MDKTITQGALTLYYREEGSGNPVVLIHGFAEDGAIWDQQVEILKARYRVFVPDLPGSGRSSAMGGETSIDDLAENIRLLLDREGIEKCVLIGHSMGGYITLAFAQKYPERLSGFGLFHSTAYADSEEKKAARNKSIVFIRNNGAAAFIRQSTPGLFSDYTHQHHPELIEELIGRYSGFSPHALIRYYEAMIGRPDRTAVLQSFSGPILFIIGQQDGLIPAGITLKQSHMPSLSHIHILEKAGHEGMLEEPQRSSDILNSFLNFVTYS